jgi:hypothetical protein
VLNKPAANRFEAHIRGTEKRELPKWLEPKRSKLTYFVRYFTENGFIPLSDFRTLRISLEGIPLDPRKRTRWFEEAQAWQGMLLANRARHAEKLRGHHDDYVKRTGTN